MIIRSATIKDSESIIAYLLLAMEDIIYEFIGEKNHGKAVEFMRNFTEKESNQYSFQNCWVVEDNLEIIAAACLYDGANLQVLRKPIEQYIQLHFNKEFNHGDETQAGEFYIDCIAVNPECQGRGIGTKLLQFLIDEYVSRQELTLGLLVDKENPNAKRLYLKLGFEVADERTLAGKPMEHLQLMPR